MEKMSPLRECDTFNVSATQLDLGCSGDMDRERLFKWSLQSTGRDIT